MGSIKQVGKKVVIKIKPGELLMQPVYDYEMNRVGDHVRDIIMRVGWSMLKRHAEHLMKNKKFVQSEVLLLDGEYVISFYEEMPEVEEPPKVSER